MVLGPMGQPVVRHDSEYEARAEAERLARSRTGQEFVVLESVASCTKRDVHWNEMVATTPREFV